MYKRFFYVLLIICNIIMNTSCNNQNRSGNFVDDKMKMIATGYGSNYLLILQEDGSVYEVLGGNLSHIKRVNGLSDITYVSVGTSHALALDVNGVVWEWELAQTEKYDEDDKNIIVPHTITSLDNVKMISAGGAHYAAVKNDGSVWLWGNNDEGEIGDGTYISREKPVKIQGISDVVKIVCGDKNTVALRADGTVYEWGMTFTSESAEEVRITYPMLVESIPKIIDIGTGHHHTIALGEDGFVYTWGNNDSGQLGRIYDERDTLSPLRVQEIKDIIKISAGPFYNLALSQDGDVWRWGQDIEYIIDEVIMTPQKVKNLENIKYISSASDFFVAVNADNIFEIITRYKKNDFYYTKSASIIAVMLIPFIFIIVIIVYFSRKHTGRKNN